MTQQKAAPILDYSPPRRRWIRLSRRQWITLVTVGILASLGAIDGPSLYRKTRFQYYQHLCQTYELPLGTVVYDDDPASVPSLLAKPEYRPGVGCSLRCVESRLRHLLCSVGTQSRVLHRFLTAGITIGAWAARLSTSAAAPTANAG